MKDIKVEALSTEEVKRRGIQSWGIWEKEPSEFDWDYTNEEHCYILEGRAKVTEGDKAVEIKRGDYVVFPAGLQCRWKVTESIRKYFQFK